MIFGILGAAIYRRGRSCAVCERAAVGESYQLGKGVWSFRSSKESRVSHWLEVLQLSCTLSAYRPGGLGEEHFGGGSWDKLKVKVSASMEVVVVADPVL